MKSNKYNKMNSQCNVYPFKTCPLCGLTYTIMGKNPRRHKSKIYRREKILTSSLFGTDDDHSSFLSDDDFLGDCCQDEFISEIDEFLLAEELSKVDYENKNCYNEKFEHNLFCSKFKAAREKYTSHILTYLERCYIVNKLLPIINMDQPLPIKESFLKLLCDVYFVESLELQDFSLSHPSYQEFVSLLWYTPWFLKEMEKYLTNEEITQLQDKYPRSQGLRRNLRWWTQEDKSRCGQNDEEESELAREDDSLDEEDIFRNMEFFA